MTTIDAFPEAFLDPRADNDRRYTVSHTNAIAQRLAEVSGWDLDVAADDESHLAERYYTIRDDGLSLPWFVLPPQPNEVCSVWCNPPYSSLMPWVEKAWEESRIAMRVGRPFAIAMLLPGDRGEQPWWQRWVEPWRDGRGENPACPGVQLKSHVLPGRQVFGHPGNREGVAKSSAPFPSVLLVWRRSPATRYLSERELMGGAS